MKKDIIRPLSIICPKCGKKLKENEKICPKCKALIISNLVKY